MAKMTITDSEEFESPPAGVYAATCQSITPEEGQFGPSYKWVWELIEVLSTEDDDDAADFIGEDIWGWSSQSASTKGKFVKWAAAHLGVAALDAGESVDTDDLIGASVRLTIETTSDGDSTKHKVASVGLYKKPKRRAIVTVEEDDDDEPELVTAGPSKRKQPF